MGGHESLPGGWDYLSTCLFEEQSSTQRNINMQKKKKIELKQDNDKNKHYYSLILRKIKVSKKILSQRGWLVRIPFGGGGGNH